MDETMKGAGNPPETAVLLANLGTPDKPRSKEVARFLREFLSDPRVIDLPRWLWLPLLYLVIVPLRSRRSAAAYREIWTEEGSPLLVLTLKLAKKLAVRLGATAVVATGMRYGKPSIATAMKELQLQGIRKLIILPLYPQYSATTTASIFDAVEAALQELNWKPQQVRIDDYHRHPQWIDAVADTIRQYRHINGAAEKLLFSLHGIPERYVRNGDPYAQQCRDSITAIAEQAGLKNDEWLLTFQSRVGREPWLQPYTELTLQQLAESGVKHVQVICPGFAVDCLETLEEIELRNCEMFKSFGGQSLKYIPALNDRDAHVEALASLVNEL